MYHHKQADLRSDGAWFQPCVCMMPVSLSLLLRYHCSYFFFFLALLMACRISVPCPGTEPMPPAMEAPSCSQRTVRGIPAAGLRGDLCLQHTDHPQGARCRHLRQLQVFQAERKTSPLESPSVLFLTQTTTVNGYFHIKYILLCHLLFSLHNTS